MAAKEAIKVIFTYDFDDIEINTSYRRKNNIL